MRKFCEEDAAKGVILGDDAGEMAKSFPIAGLRDLFIHNSQGQMQFIADLGVYTRNRHFI